MTRWRNVTYICNSSQIVFSNASEQMNSLGKKGYINDQQQQRAFSMLPISRAHTLRGLGALRGCFCCFISSLVLDFHLICELAS